MPIKNKLANGVFVRRKRGRNLGLGKIIERVGRKFLVWFETDKLVEVPPSNLKFIGGRDL